MGWFVLASLLVAAREPAPKIEGEQFVNIIRGLHAEVRDFSFIYEGERQLVRPGASQEDRESFREKYQGVYAFRGDGSIYLDLYYNGGPDSRLFRSRAAILRDQTELLAFEPDTRQLRRIEVKPRNPYALPHNSPHQFLFYWYFQSMADTRSLDYEFRGWETVDGRKCLKVQLGFSPRPPGSKNPLPAYVFWIDLERGGNPIKIDHMIQHPGVAGRTHVELERFRLPNGKPVWFPISAVFDTFAIAPGKYSDDPTIRETYTVVRRTLRFNQGLLDSTFTVKREGQVAGSTDLVLRKEFKEAESHTPPFPRNDPASVKEMLDKKLAEADKQSKMLEASSVASATWGWSGLAPLGLVGIGLVFVTIAALLWRHAGR